MDPPAQPSIIEGQENLETPMKLSDDDTTKSQTIYSQNGIETETALNTENVVDVPQTDDVDSTDQMNIDESQAVNGDVVYGSSSRSEEATKYWDLVDKNRQDFDSWSMLIGVVEREDNLEAVQEVYNEFLLYYPYCYGYWKKYADYVLNKVGEDEAQKIYEEAVLAIGLSVDLWISYIDFCMNKGDSEDDMRVLFERAIESSGLDFRSDQLWDKYIDWETKNSQLIYITQIYKKLLHIPTKGYSTHYENLKQHIDNNDLTSILTPEELSITRVKAEKALANESEDPDSIPITNGDDNGDASDPDHISDALRRAIKVILYDEFHAVYSHNEKETAKRWNFEEGIRRPYFHSKALDAGQLKNWRDYLDFEMGEGNDLRTVTLFERCMIACAQYEEFWLKYTTYLEGMDRQADVRNVYTRACRQHLPYKASMHINWAFYEERQGNFDDALAIIENIESHAGDNMCVINHKLNLLRRRGNDVSEMFQQYIDSERLSAESLKLLVSKYVRYIHKIVGNKDKAIEILKDNIKKHDSHEPFYIQLLDMEYQQQPVNEEKVLAVFDMINSSSLSQEIKQKFYSRRYEFVDDLGSDVKKLYSAYQNYEETMLSGADDKKRSLADGDKEGDDAAKKVKTESYDQNQAYSQQYGQNYSGQYGQDQYYNGTGDWSQYYNQQGQYGSQYGNYSQQQQGYGGGYQGYNYSGYSSYTGY